VKQQDALATTHADEKPPLVKTTATSPVSAREAVLKPVTPRSKAVRARRVANFFML
jgi:hypothetical protein